MKHYEIRITLANKQVIHGPVIKRKDYKDWYDLLKDYPDGGTLRLLDLDRTFIIPSDVMCDGYIEIRRISILKRLLRWAYRLITR